MRSFTDAKIKKLEKIFNIKIKNKEIFEQALIHGSYTKENNIDYLENYERLEFLGDAVLKLCVSEILYTNFPVYSEGDLTKIRSIIISDNVLAEIAKNIGLNELIIIGKQEEKLGGRERKSILACAFEAVLAAYYLDGKGAKLLQFLETTLTPYIKDVDENFEKFNAKAILQEYTQSQSKDVPVYKVVEEKGPQHDKVFVVEVSYADKVLATGCGKTKKEAQQSSALEACINLGVIKG